MLDPGSLSDWDIEPGEVPLYVCPIDYDLLCGGFVATVTRSDQAVRWSGFRYTSSSAEASDELTTVLGALDFTFEAAELDRVVCAARDRFQALAAPKATTDRRLGVLRRALLRVHR